MQGNLIVFTAFLLLLLAGCSGDSDSDEEETNPDFSALKAPVDEFEVEDMALVVGDRNGILFTYEKGDFTADTQVMVASANKWLTGATIWILIEQGLISRHDNPQDYIDFWTGDENDSRSQITFDSLLGQRSGFNNSPIEQECIGYYAISIYDCVRTLYDGGVDTTPDSEFWYGPEHFQMAGLMASAAMGYQNFQTIMREYLFDRVDMSEATTYIDPSNTNARYSGAIRTTANDYAKFLRALLAGELMDDMAGFLEDRTAEVTYFWRPDGPGNGLEWHYGFGFWKECDDESYNMECDIEPTVSSPGAFGFTPWIDFKNGYWGVISFAGKEDDPSFRSSRESVLLEQQLQPMIETILSSGT